MVMVKNPNYKMNRAREMEVWAERLIEEIEELTEELEMIDDEEERAEIEDRIAELEEELDYNNEVSSDYIAFGYIED